MTIGLIVLATLAGGLVSVLLAATLALTVLRRYANLMVSFAVGALLTAAFIGMLPHALESGLPAEQVGAWVLAGLLGFFLLEKSTLWRHSHGGDMHTCELKSVVPMVVIGDALHNFVDGVAIAAAFMVDTHLGIATAVAILLHEIPQELADFMVLLAAGLSRRRALLLNLLSGAATVAGGVLGYFMLGDARPMLPIVLALAAASFIYIAVSDLVPHLQRQPGLGASALQLLLIGTGGVAVLLGHIMAHAHAH
jgi:zinc and cadmium transporter